MADIVARIRFFAFATTRPPTYEAGNAVQFFAEFEDRDTGVPVAVSGVTARIFAPGNAEITPAPTPVLVGNGLYTIATTFAAFVGTWAVEVACTGPEAVVARREVLVRQTLPSGSSLGTPSTTVSAVGRSLVLSQPTALTFAAHHNATLILTGSAHQISLTWSATGDNFSCVLVNDTTYDATPALSGFTEAVVRNGSGRVSVAAGGAASLFCQEIGADRVAYLVGEIA